MTNQVSPEAVEAVLRSRGPMATWQERAFRPTVEADLQAALPALREQLEAEVRERLLSEKAIRAAESRFFHVEARYGSEYPDMVEEMIRAGLDAAFPPTDGGPISDRIDYAEVKQWLDEHGEEPVRAGTREQLEKLTTVCPVCEADDSGGGVDEPPSAMSTCTNCVGGRVSLNEAEVRERLDALADAVRDVMPILNMDGERHPKLEAALDAAFPPPPEEER